MMQIAEFQDLLDRHGEDISAWPQDRREPAMELLRTSQQARDLVAEAQALRDAFGMAEKPAAPSGLAQRIVAKATDEKPAPRRRKSQRSALIF